jgi:hypothetical protein
MDFRFGQPDNAIVQIAFIVPDLDDAMTQFTERLGVGPWQVMRDFAGDNPMYRNEPTEARAHVALGFSGHMQYELIQPVDEHPSVHRDVLESRGYGFHHFGYARPRFDEAVAEMRARGYEPIFTASLGGDSRVAYFDTRDALPGMTEFLEFGPAVENSFTQLYEAHRDR